MSNQTVKVPLSVLAASGDENQMVQPGAGETVSFEAAGTVENIEGDSATVRLTEIEGQALPEEAEPETEETSLETMLRQGDREEMM